VEYWKIKELITKLWGWKRFPHKNGVAVQKYDKRGVQKTEPNGIEKKKKEGEKDLRGLTGV